MIRANFTPCTALIVAACSKSPSWQIDACDDPTVYQGPVDSNESTPLGTVASWNAATSQWTGLGEVTDSSVAEQIGRSVLVTLDFDLVDTDSEVPTSVQGLEARAAFMPTLSAEAIECVPSLSFTQRGRLVADDLTVNGVMQSTVYDAAASWPRSSFRTEDFSAEWASSSEWTFLDDGGPFSVEFAAHEVAGVQVNMQNSTGGRVVLHFVL